MIRPFVLSCAAFLATTCILPAAVAQTTVVQTPASPTAQTLLDMSRDVASQLVPSSPQVTVSRHVDAPKLVVTMTPGADSYPGIRINPAQGAWDLSRFGHVEARVTNISAKPLTLSLRVDNAVSGQNDTWNTESITIAPGESRALRTFFGYSYGFKPGYKLKPQAVVSVLLFAAKSGEHQVFVIDSLRAAGASDETPPVAPDAVRIKPRDGVLFVNDGTFDVIDDRMGIMRMPPGFGPPSTQAQVPTPNSSTRPSLRTVSSSQKEEFIGGLKPDEGRWDLSNFSEVRVRIQNRDNSCASRPFTPRVRIESNGGASDWVVAPTPLGSGQETELVVPLAGAASSGAPIDLSRPETASRITRDAISAIVVSTTMGRPRSLQIVSIKAAVPAFPIPPRMGQRPPVIGNWVKTFEDNFDGTKLNASLWNIYGENYWDKSSHWSKDNVLIGGGVVRLRYTKKTGFNNDDPKQKPSDYASGYLHTYDRWRQRYGYFEARMKLPTAPGLWPAFWMMPDRGVASGEQWKRQSTSDGGMEFDIMEHLTRWGGSRYNIAMHYDGYDKDHKHIGSDKIYLQPDKDGFITCGLLWTPGSAIFYGNGREVARWATPRIASVPGVMMFTLPNGGWDNDALDHAKLPSDFIIDYVRVWQRKDLASSVDGKVAAPKAK